MAWNLSQHSYEEIREVVVDIMLASSSNGVNQFQTLLEHVGKAFGRKHNSPACQHGWLIPGSRAHRGMKASSKPIRTEPPGDAGKHGENDIACSAMSAICRLSVLLAVSIFSASVAVAEPRTVGAVDKVQAHVDDTQSGQTRAWLSTRSSISEIDATAQGAHLQATLKDGTQLTLCENATSVVAEFIHEPSMSRGALSVSVIRGAFLYVGGRIEGVNGTKAQIRTPVGAIGVRGTEVLGGPIDKGYRVIALSGEVSVTGRRGTGASFPD
jgi:hypothetical protein